MEAPPPSSSRETSQISRRIEDSPGSQAQSGGLAPASIAPLNLATLSIIPFARQSKREFTQGAGDGDGRGNGLRSALLAVLFTVIGTHAFAQNSLTITDGQSAGLASETLSVLMDADDSVEGFVLAITFDSALLSVSDIVAGSATLAASAELIVPETLPGGFTLGVVVDATAPFDGQEISAGTDLQIAAFTLTPQTIVTTDTQSAVEFSDGVLNNPPLSNLLVQNGQSIDASNGLGLNNGTMTLLPPPPDSMRIESTEFDSDSSGAARVLLSNSSGAVQGFVLAVAHDSAVVTLQGITLGDETLAAGAELVVPEVYSSGGTLGVVLDFESPFEGQSIPTGDDNHIASFTYSSNSVIENNASSSSPF